MNPAILLPENDSAIISIMLNFRRMNMLGGILKSLVNPASLMQLAMGPAGWASLAMKTIGTAIAQQVIQKLGQELGLPPAIINMAQQAFSAAAGQPGNGGQIPTMAQTIGNFAKEMGLNAVQEGDLFRGSSKLSDSINKMVLDQIKNARGDEDTKQIQQGKKPGAKGSQVTDAIASRNQGFLMKLATALGKLMDQKMNDMASLTDEIGRLGQVQSEKLGKFGEVTGKNQGKYEAIKKEGDSQLATLNGQLQGLSQEVNMLSQSLNTTIKTLGEANSTLARKG
jgi:hypothetical protein